MVRVRLLMVKRYAFSIKDDKHPKYETSCKKTKKDVVSAIERAKNVERMSLKDSRLNLIGYDNSFAEV